jgi:hypothetical protein
MRFSKNTTLHQPYRTVKGYVLPKLAADVMYLSPVVKRTGSVKVLVPR